LHISHRFPFPDFAAWHRAEWIVDADLKDFFGSVDHEELLTLVAQRISDGPPAWFRFP
jgi:retron-type reverse transcriptase